MLVAVPFISSFFLMPIIGYGTWLSDGDAVSSGVEEALNSGYRHIDCAETYMNEQDIGRVIQKWLSSGKIKRNDLFVTSKLSVARTRPSDVLKGLDNSLQNLNLNYLDLFLVHVPFGLLPDTGMLPFYKNGSAMIDYTTDIIKVWKEMENLVKLGKVKNIGLSNFNISQIQRILDICEIKPVNLQIEVHLYFQQKELLEFCQKNNITVTAYSPIGARGIKKAFDYFGHQQEQVPNLFEDPMVQKLSKKYNKSPAQILLRHLVHKNIAVIPKSTRPKHIKENIEILDFQLTESEIKELNTLDKGENGRILDFKMLKGIETHPEYPFN